MASLKMAPKEGWAEDVPGKMRRNGGEQGPIVKDGNTWL